jgi:hypothetical protein
MSATTIAVAANVVTLAPIPLLKFGLVTSTRAATTPLLRVPKNAFYDDFGFLGQNSLFSPARIPELFSDSFAEGIRLKAIMPET